MRASEIILLVDEPVKFELVLRRSPLDHVGGKRLHLREACNDVGEVTVHRMATLHERRVQLIAVQIKGVENDLFGRCERVFLERLRKDFHPLRLSSSCRDALLGSLRPHVLRDVIVLGFLLPSEDEASDLPEYH